VRKASNYGSVNRQPFGQLQHRSQQPVGRNRGSTDLHARAGELKVNATRARWIWRIATFFSSFLKAAFAFFAN
jgi:hypothetical protein